MSESSPDLLRLVLSRLQEGVLIVGADGRVRDANVAAGEIFGMAHPEMEGRMVADLAGEVRNRDGHILGVGSRPIARALRGEEVSGAVMCFERHDGHDVWVEVEAGPLRTQLGHVGGAMVTLHDVTHLVERERRYRHEADHDHLTGLANRRLLERTLDATIARAMHNDRGVAILLVDLDGFKEINDRHGHAAGDVVLRKVATRLRRNLRERDLVARFGGDEFVLVLADLQHPEEIADAFAERVHDALIEHMEIDDDLSLQVGASIGRATHPADGRDAAALLEAADRAMYAEKR